ncbi:response regulator transcription factor [Peribacillus glennii]|uniref:Response regulator n=1 Tax=Peribacillus glennii TaxID=2303991 RepID=A0A372LIQ6_9BACI|nr:response regulator transcription factor [Peribacillus glennii]RFU65864.1 response regulator [Peribacillus glennii]
MKRILLAEDEEVLRMLLVDMLEDEGFDIDEATDGQEALEFLQSNQYDLVLLDYMMPVYTGLEIIEKLRSDDSTKDLKIMMLSAKSQQKEQDAVLVAGADYFMAKPFSPLELLAKIEGILNENK